MISHAERWLLALADPIGPAADLPARPLSAGTAESLLTAADRHGVLPAVVANLQRIDREAACSEQVEERLADARERLVARTGLSLLLRSQLQQIEEACAAEGLSFAVLKGPEFCDRLYPDPALRPFTDLDLLVSEDSAGAMAALLERSGYRPLAEPGRKHETGYGERGWRRPGAHGGLVEVHWDLVNSPPLRRRISVGLEDLDCPDGPGRLHPSPSALLAVAAVHAAAGHRFDRLQPLVDVAQAARGAAGELDADWLSAFGRATGSSGVLTTALWLAGRALGEARCRDACAALGRPRPGRLVRLLLNPAVVLRSHRPGAKLRRQLYREVLKRT